MLDATPRIFIGTTIFQVAGMTCEHCQRAVIATVSRVPGVCGVAIDLSSGSVTVTVIEPVDRVDIARAVDDAGFTLIP